MLLTTSNLFLKDPGVRQEEALFLRHKRRLLLRHRNRNLQLLIFVYMFCLIFGKSEDRKKEINGGLILTVTEKLQ